MGKEKQISFLMPLVSVILPCYNSHATIKQAIDSIISQTFTDWELLVVDDASIDDSIKIIKDIRDPRIKIIRQPVNGGYSVAMNTGIAEAKGRYIARMDADDVSAPKRLQEQIKALELYPLASLCGVARYRITPGGKMYVDRKKYDNYYKIETWDDLMRGNRIFTDPSVMVERERIVRVSGYRTFQRSGMDVDLWLRIMENFGPCITVTAPLFGKRLEPGSLVFNPNTNMINQIPRVLARQRMEKGVDDLQAGRNVDVGEYKRLGWLKEEEINDKFGLFFGSFVTCLWLQDWAGAAIYFRHIRYTGDLSLVKIIFMVVRKIFERIRENPFMRYDLPA